VIIGGWVVLSNQASIQNSIVLAPTRSLKLIGNLLWTPSGRKTVVHEVTQMHRRLFKLDQFQAPFLRDVNAVHIFARGPSHFSVEGQIAANWSIWVPASNVDAIPSTFDLGHLLLKQRIFGLMELKEETLLH
jgi:hypothetical protein